MVEMMGQLAHYATSILSKNVIYQGLLGSLLVRDQLALESLFFPLGFLFFSLDYLLLYLGFLLLH
uniref:Uncharacterized protein n=1 Tax=Romanomermis culicivorax TaxID=13658 RepID=A0A915INU7_ROMCU